MANHKKPDDKKFVKQSVSFDPDQLKEVLAYCQKEERTISWVVRKALAEWLPEHMD